MSQANDLLNRLNEGDVNLYTADPEAEGHIVIGTDRSITIPEELQRIAVQRDHNIETVTFDCPRYWDGHDLMDMDIYINYKNANNVLGAYLAQNVTVDANDNSIIHFTWTISGAVTTHKGNIVILVCAKVVDVVTGEELIHWNSEINNDMYVSEGLEAVAATYTGDTDLYTQLITIVQSTEVLDPMGSGVNSERHNGVPKENASGMNSFVQGRGTIARGSDQHARGRFNVADTENKYADIVGKGTSDTDRSNAYTLDWDGNAEYAGTVKAADPVDPNDCTTKHYVDDSASETKEYVDKSVGDAKNYVDESVKEAKQYIDESVGDVKVSSFRLVENASTYPRFIKRGEDLYLFLDNSFIVSKNNGATWSKKTVICSSTMDSELAATDKVASYTSVANAMPIISPDGKLQVFYRANNTPNAGDTTSVRYTSIRMREIGEDNSVSDPVIILENAEVPLRTDTSSKPGGYWEPFPIVISNKLYLYYSDDATADGSQSIKCFNVTANSGPIVAIKGSDANGAARRPGMSSIFKVGSAYYMIVENTDRAQIGSSGKSSFVELYTSANGVNNWTSCGPMFFDIPATITCAPYIYALSDGRVAISFQTNEKTVENAATSASKHQKQRAYVYISNETEGAPQDRTYEPVNEYNYASNECGYWCGLYEVNGVLYSAFTHGYHDINGKYNPIGNVIATSEPIPDIAPFEVESLNLNNGRGKKSLEIDDCTAYGDRTVATGKGTVAVGLSEIAMGQYNVPTVSTASSSRRYRGEWSIAENYLVRDVVLDNGKYYVAKKAVVADDYNPIFTTNTTYWTLISGESKSTNIITVGKGTSDADRSNAFELGWDGHGRYAGGVSTEAYKGTDPDIVPQFRNVAIFKQTPTSDEIAKLSVGDLVFILEEEEA